MLNQTIKLGDIMLYQIPPFTFIDPDGDALSYEAY